ncbi:centromere-associated protein E-like [Ptychodera flava]|uniref:centromere-associated protein E-like n=1 Tax=Ptychodera flava TaxID=63121 RepID=UPI00396A50E9
MEGSAALFITSWKRNSYGPANWKLITDFCENTLKKKQAEVSKIHCTVLDVDVGEEVKEDAARYGVTLIPATRPKSSHPDEDPPVTNWLLFHQSYYPGLGRLENINHVVALSSNVKKTAAALQESVFPGAKFHPPPDQPSAAVFINEAWNKDALGLTGFHKTLVQDFCERKAKAGETLKAYSTVLDVKISDDQKKDAESCGVTLIPAQRKEKADHRDDPQKLEWLLNHEIYYPDLREVENVQYVIGYAPKTGRAAADIRRKLFPGAKLVLINHARPEANCLQAEEHGLSEFEEKMLQMASEADILFSIGPYIHDYFENAYRAEVQGRDLSGIPHEEILPRPDTCFWVKKPKEKPVAQHHILSCGQMDTQNAIERCKSIAASIGTVANRRKEHYSSHPEWKIQGVSKKAGKTEQKILADASESPYVYPKLKPGHSIKSLLTSLQQSHLCLPSPCYWDYSLYGLEAMTFGLPTSVHDDSHLAHFVMKHLEMCADYCVIRDCEVNLSKKILEHLEKTSDSFKKANALKAALTKCEAITESFAKFASLLQEPIKKVHEGDCKGQEVATCADVSLPSSDCEVSTQSTKQVPESINGKISTLAVTRDGSIGRQAIEETRDDVIDKEDTEYGQTTITPSEMENENSNTEEGMVRNQNDEQQDILVKVALDEDMLYKSLRELEEQAKALSVQLRRPQETKKTEVKAAWGECEHCMKRRVQAVLADEDSCNEVKKVWTERVGLDPTTVTAESLGILLKILTLYYLYRLKQTCRYRNLAKALEPLLITDEMREIAAKHGITLQLKATYDTLKFEEIEHFFINRDGGGVQPLTFHDEIEDEGHCNIDPMDEEPPLSQQASDQAAEQISQTNLEQDFEEKLVAQHGELTQPITAAQESQARSLLPIKPSEQQLTDSDIRYLALAESKVQSLQSQLEKACTEKQIVETQLAEALEEKSQLEKQCQEYKQRYHSAEKVALTAKLKKVDPKNIEDLQTQLKEQNTVITELKAKLSKLSDAQSDIEPQMKTEESLQLGEQIITSEIVHKEVTEPSADNVYIKPKINEIEEEKKPKQ